jgi:hypothetical protein
LFSIASKQRHTVIIRDLVLQYALAQHRVSKRHHCQDGLAGSLCTWMKYTKILSFSSSSRAWSFSAVAHAAAMPAK